MLFFYILLLGKTLHRPLQGRPGPRSHASDEVEAGGRSLKAYYRGPNNYLYYFEVSDYNYSITGPKTIF